MGKVWMKLSRLSLEATVGQQCRARAVLFILSLGQGLGLVSISARTSRLRLTKFIIIPLKYIRSKLLQTAVACPS